MISFKFLNFSAILLFLSQINKLIECNECPYAQLRYQQDADRDVSAALISASSEVDLERILKTIEPIPVPGRGSSGESINNWLQRFLTKSTSASAPSPYVGGNLNNNVRIDPISSVSENLIGPKISATPRLACAVAPSNCGNDTSNYYYRTFDGSCNNLANPDYGIAKSRFTRLLPPKYGDGVYAPSLSITGGHLPNPRTLSLSLYGEVTTPDEFRTLAVMQWGQIVAHDLSQFSIKGAPKDCCADVSNPRCYPIPLSPYEPIALASGKSCLHVARSVSDLDIDCSKSDLPYAEKISIVNGYLDLSSIYGNSLKESKKIRLHQYGLLKTSTPYGKQLLPVETDAEICGSNLKQCYSIPDRRNQFTPTIIILHTILLREHNRIAGILRQLNPQWSDERLFQEARKINIGQYQKITYYDWLHLLIGLNYAYDNNLIYNVYDDEYVRDYNDCVNAAPYAEYAAAAMRYAHQQVPGWFSLVSPRRDSNETLRLSNYFGPAEAMNLIAHGSNLDRMIRGLVTQVQKKSDSNVDVELKHYFNRKPKDEVGSDLKSLDIQRGRDFGIPPYNDFRQFCGLSRAKDWSDFSQEIPRDKIEALRKTYATPDDVELSIGGSYEAHAPGSLFGPTFQCIVGRQFLKTRVADRFFFEREDLFSGFNREQLAEIRKASLSGLLCNNGDYLRYIQLNSFVFPSTRNILRNCQEIPQVDLNKWREVEQNTYVAN